MFTGITSHVSQVKASQRKNDGLLVTFQKPEEWSDLELGESVATDGVCLTVTAIRADEYDCVLVQETLDKSTFGTKVPERVNVERALRVGDRMGGHMVQGHVDTVGKVVKITDNDGYKVEVEFPASLDSLVAYKGSICLNGVALTVTANESNTFEVAVIPYTLQHTTLGSLQNGDAVNLEFDMIGKYVAKAVENNAKS